MGIIESLLGQSHGIKPRPKNRFALFDGGD